MSRQLNIYLMGKTGNGKSSTGNSIVGDTPFYCPDSASSATQAVDSDEKKINNYTVTIVDTPGMRNTTDTSGRVNTSGEVRLAMEYVYQALSRCPEEEIHLFLLVLPFGGKYIGDEVGVVQDLTKKGYAKYMLERTAVLFTHGRDFELKCGSGPGAFQQWCMRQTGKLEELFKSVDYRCVLFENLQPDAGVQAFQRQVVLDMANDIRSRKGPFTKRGFLNSLSWWDKLSLGECSIQ